MPPHKRAYRPVVMGRRGAVASAHPLASMAGIQMLLAGGNAVDAAVAVASTLNVVEPFMSGVGGVGLMLLSRGSQRHVLDFIGRAPRAADPAACTDDELAGGPKSCATPGNLGGWLVEEDLAALAPEWREPATIAYRDHQVSSVPPPFSAFQMLETLNVLEGYDVAAWGHNSVEYLHHLIEAVKLASADRLAYAYTPEVPIGGLLSKAYAVSQRARIDPVRAGRSEGERWNREKLPTQILEGHPAHFVNEHTTHFACADASGTVVTVTQTLGVPFGSGFAVPGTGIVLNNILKWMDRDPESPIVLRAGRRAGTMMSPTQVFRDGAFAMSIGTPGSYGILQTTPQMLLNVLEFGMNIQEAIEAPRVRIYRDRRIDAEARIPADTRAALAGRGHQVNVIDEWSWIVGGGQGIVRDRESGALMAGADPRRDGYALAI